MIDTSPKLKFTDASLLLLDIYESSFGIHNHSQYAGNNSRPLALVAMNWEENNTEQSTLHERIEQFKDRNVYQHFGLNLIDFLNLPRDYCIKILEVCSKKQNQEGQIAQELTNRFDKIQSGK